MIGHDWLAIASIIVSGGTAAVLFIGRKFIAAWISKGVQHGFDVIEQIRADLRVKESEISALQNAVFAGSANRQSLIDKRRFEAVEKVWSTVNELAQFKMIACIMAVVNFNSMSKQARDPNLQKLLETIAEWRPT
jgi:hypothetical protein